MRTTTESVTDVSSRGCDAPVQSIWRNSREKKIVIGCVSLAGLGVIFFVSSLLYCAYALAVTR